MKSKIFWVTIRGASRPAILHIENLSQPTQPKIWEEIKFKFNGRTNRMFQNFMPWTQNIPFKLHKPTKPFK